MLNRADECRRRADECRRNAAQGAEDVLPGTYLDLARRWRMMAHQAETLEQKVLGSNDVPHYPARLARSRLLAPAKRMILQGSRTQLLAID